MSHVHATPDESARPEPTVEPPRTRWQQLGGWFTGQQELTHVPTSSDPDVLLFATPTLGDAYEFRISIRCEWQLAAARDWRGEPNVLRTEVAALDQARTAIRPRLQDLARRVVRNFPPHRPAEAEQALTEALSGGVTANGLRCDPVACVTVPDEILEQLQSHWQEQMAYELRADRAEVLAEQVDRMRRTWQAFLLDSLHPEPGPNGEEVGWLVPHVLELAERPVGLAAKVRGLTDQRNTQAIGLASDLSALLNRSQDLDVLEFLISTDTALRQTMRLLGVPLPPPAEGSALHDAQTASPA